MKQAICTIVAKNYLPLAFALGESISKHHPDIYFAILLSDSVDGLDLNSLPYKVLPLDVLDISESDLMGMKFKYNVTEFSTSVKPLLFRYLFSLDFQKVIYFDPDVYLFSDVTEIFIELEAHSIVVTPHILTCETTYTGTITESLLLHVGIFNFGFIAIFNDEIGNKMIDWWENRLINFCYQDKIEALHTDQKWGDFLPVFFGKNLLISEDLGRNVAFWNLHERYVYQKDGIYYVKNKIEDVGETKLIFFHFAGFDFYGKSNLIHKNHPEYIIEDYPEIKNLYSKYRELILKNDFEKYINLDYSFDFFSDGRAITFYHRRLFRRLEESKYLADENFFHVDGFVYSIFKKNKLISNSLNSKKIEKLKETNFNDFNAKLKFLNFFMSLLFKIIGPDKYFLLLKFCQRYFRPENQFFLLKEFRKNYYFLNENRKNVQNKG